MNRPWGSLIAPMVLAVTFAAGFAPPPARPEAAGAPLPVPAPDVAGRAEPLPARSAHQAGGPTAEGLTALQFVGPARGWVAGLGFILATSDGGQTWTPQLSTTDPISSFAFVDASTGWAVGAHTLVGTTDGGQHWQQRGDADPPLVRVSFATPDLGWGVPALPRVEVARDGTPVGLPAARLLGSRDGGQTWVEVSAPGPLQSICRADVEHGWGVGNGRVWRQASAAEGWTLALTSPAAQQAEAPAGPGVGFGGEVQCFGADVAWVLFTAPGAMMQTGWALYRTSDAGATWTAVAQSGQFFPETGAPHGSGAWNRVRLAAVDATTAYVVGTCVPCSPPGAAGSGAVSLGVSRDAGQSWQDLPPLPATFGAAIVSAPFAASFPTAEQGWVLAPGSATLYATADGGATWTPRPLDVGR